MRFFFALISAFFISGCALAPLMAPKTARPLGEGNWSVEGDLMPSIGINVGRGFTERFDAGILVETQLGTVASIWGKYAFIDGGMDKTSLAFHGGAFVGSSFGTSDGFFIGPIVSHRFGSLEISAGVRYNYVTWRAGDLTTEEQDDSIFDFISWGDITLNYIQTDIAFTFWTSDSFAISISGKNLSAIGDGVTVGSGVLPGFGLIYKW